MRTPFAVGLLLFAYWAVAQDVALTDSAGISKKLSKAERERVASAVADSLRIDTGTSTKLLHVLPADNDAPLLHPKSPVVKEGASINKSLLQRILQLQKDRQRVLDGSNPPMQLTDQGLRRIPGLSYSNLPSLNDALGRAIKSVGRIENKNAGELEGTGWMYSPTLVATNCHVALNLVDATDRTRIPPQTFYIDFADSDRHDATREFEIQGVEFLSDKDGFDFALLKIAPQSQTGSNSPPTALPRRAPTVFPTHVSLVGWVTSTQPGHDMETKKFVDAIAGLGATVHIVATGDVSTMIMTNGYGVLLHTADTHYGASGSPLLDDAGNVIGIHYCCNVTEEDADSGCSRPSVVAPYNNLAISGDALVEQQASAAQSRIIRFEQPGFRF